MYEEPTKPAVPDYYADLGVTKDAEKPQIKKAFRILAIQHHPDKKGLGNCEEAVEFCRVYNAYEILTNDDKKATYDANYYNVEASWMEYYYDLEEWKTHVKEQERLREEAEELARQKAAKEKQREAAREAEYRKYEEAERARSAENNLHRRRRGNAKKHHRSLCRCHSCLDARWTKFQDRAFFNENFTQRAEEAQRKSEEAAERARKEQIRQAEERLAKQQAAEQKKQERDQAAQERKKAAKSRTAELRTQEAARRHREEQQKQAQLRLATKHIEKQQQLYLAANTNTVGEVTVVIDLAWVKKKGVAQCLFCDEKIKHFSFHCPEGGAVACNSCKKNLSRYTLPTPRPKDEDGDLQDLTDVTLEDGGDGK